MYGYYRCGLKVLLVLHQPVGYILYNNNKRLLYILIINIYSPTCINLFVARYQTDSGDNDCII
jgi:hypothetical protein